MSDTGPDRRSVCPDGACPAGPSEDSSSARSDETCLRADTHGQAGRGTPERPARGRGAGGRGRYRPRRLARGRERPPSPSREAAVNVLLAAEHSGRFASDLVHEQIAQARLSPPDRALVTELVFGVVRRHATLDAVIAAYSDTKIWRVDSRLLWILRVAVYQMLFLTRIPARAAVDEAVRLTRRLGLGMQTGFANALLRTISRAITPAGPLADRAAGARHVIPIEGEATVVTTRAVLPDPAKDTVGYLSTAYSYPEWLVRRWLERFGPERARALLAAGNERPRLYLRANRLRTTREDLLKKLAMANVPARAADAPEAVELLAHHAVADLPGFAEGLFYVQDLTAMRVAPRVAPRPGERILDLCAAPGGKATHLAELMGNEGTVVASDESPGRLALVVENVRRLGTTIVTTATPEAVEGAFDAVLLDAPCTNTGVLARRAEARWRLTDEALARAVALQNELLDRAARHVRPGGRLIYSTCSTESEEDRGVIDAFLTRHADFALRDDALTLPQPGLDGGYVAVLDRHSRGRREDG